MALLITILSLTIITISSDDNNIKNANESCAFVSVPVTGALGTDGHSHSPRRPTRLPLMALAGTVGYDHILRFWCLVCLC